MLWVGGVDICFDGQPYKGLYPIPFLYIIDHTAYRITSHGTMGDAMRESWSLMIHRRVPWSNDTSPCRHSPSFLTDQSFDCLNSMCTTWTYTISWNCICICQLIISPFHHPCMHACVVIVKYSLRSIILFANMDVSTTKMCLDTSMLTKSIMSRREYCFDLFRTPTSVLIRLRGGGASNGAPNFNKVDMFLNIY
jgi:hypothetical protein